MKKILANGGESRLHAEIAGSVAGFAGDIYRKIRIADVIDIGQLSARHLGTYALQAHFDVCVCDDNGKAAFAIEYDGGGHDRAKDSHKNAIAQEAGLTLFRIDERLLSRSCGGMTFLQYLVHIWFMAVEFGKLQETGQIDPTEPFMMSTFLKPDARHIFDSEYDFTRAPTLRLCKALSRMGHASPPTSRALLGMAHLLLGRGDSSFVAFASIPFGSRTIYGRARLDIGTPSLGELAEIPFGWSAIADFGEGMAIDNLADNADMALAGGHHALLTWDEVVREVSALRAAGYSSLRAGGPRGNDLMDLLLTEL